MSASCLLAPVLILLCVSFVPAAVAAERCVLTVCVDATGTSVSVTSPVASESCAFMTSPDQPGWAGATEGCQGAESFWAWGASTGSNDGKTCVKVYFGEPPAFQKCPYAGQGPDGAGCFALGEYEDHTPGAPTWFFGVESCQGQVKTCGGPCTTLLDYGSA